MEKLYKVSEVAEIFNVTQYSVRSWLKEGKIGGIKLNGRWRIPESELKKYSEKMYGETNAG